MTQEVKTPLFKVHGTGFISKADGTKVPFEGEALVTADQLKEAGLPVPPVEGATDEHQ